MCVHHQSEHACANCARDFKANKKQLMDTINSLKKCGGTACVKAPEGVAVLEEARKSINAAIFRKRGITA